MKNKCQIWINDLCKKNAVISTGALSSELIEKWKSMYCTKFGSTCSTESFKRLLRKGKQNLLIDLGILEESEIDTESEDALRLIEQNEDLIKTNVRYKKDKQKHQDSSRIERKSFREYVRIENAVSEYAQSIETLLKEEGERLSMSNPSPIEDITVSREVGMIGISDCHLNELIDLPHNKYDINVASHRLHKLATEAVLLFTSRDIKKIVVAFTGDNLNSDRRLDELLNQATNRSKATFVAVELFSKFLRHLGEYFNVTVVGVLGNESRVNKEMSFSNEAISDNYDFVICNMLKLLFKASQHPNISFGSIDQMELVIDVAGTKVLLTHDIARATASQKGAQNVIGKQYLSGNPVDVVVGGHIHSTNNSMYSFRSGSLSGSNSYNENSMHLVGRASQNLYIFGENQRMCMGVDLQNFTEGQSYKIDAALMEYDCKSLNATKQAFTVLEVKV
jgi:predicted phosphodiesterase